MCPSGQYVRYRLNVNPIEVGESRIGPPDIPCPLFDSVDFDDLKAEATKARNDFPGDMVRHRNGVRLALFPAWRPRRPFHASALEGTHRHKATERTRTVDLRFTNRVTRRAKARKRQYQRGLRIASALLIARFFGSLYRRARSRPRLTARRLWPSLSASRSRLH
jgi:hypothetical protein